MRVITQVVQGFVLKAVLPWYCGFWIFLPTFYSWPTASSGGVCSWHPFEEQMEADDALRCRI